MFSTIFPSAATGSWLFRKASKNKHYFTGDIYQDALRDDVRISWRDDEYVIFMDLDACKQVEGVNSVCSHRNRNHNNNHYLRHLRAISSEWPHFSILADFMEVGTNPLRLGSKQECQVQKDERGSRRINVRQLNYFTDGSVELVPIEDTEDLNRRLAALDDFLNEKNATGANIELSLFVVEDLSRDTIESLGYYLDIDPEFFLAHAFDYAWYNIRNPCWCPPSFRMDAARRDWFQVRFCRARYFPTMDVLEKGRKESDNFNVHRKLYWDENGSFWDRSYPRKAQRATAKFFSSSATNDEESTPGESHGPRSHITNAPGGEDEQTAQSQEKQTINGKVGLMRSRATFLRKKWGKSNRDVGE